MRVVLPVEPPANASDIFSRHLRQRRRAARRSRRPYGPAAKCHHMSVVALLGRPTHAPGRQLSGEHQSPGCYNCRSGSWTLADLTRSTEQARSRAEMAIQWLIIFKLVALLAVANGVPIVAGKLFGAYFDQPLDFGVAFVDGRPVLGRSKTIRGIVTSLVTTTALSPVLGFEWIWGLVIASAAMIGDISSSFLKRRLSLPPSSRATGIDQIPECLFPTLAVRSNS